MFEDMIHVMRRDFVLFRGEGGELGAVVFVQVFEPFLSDSLVCRFAGECRLAGRLVAVAVDCVVAWLLGYNEKVVPLRSLY